MVISESSKCLEASKGFSSGIDRISNLPDPLISNILSLLPTKCAVATSALSTRWKFRWTSITDLDIDNHVGSRKLSTEALDMKRNKFTHFVNRVLLLLNPPSIQNFRLRIRKDLFDPTYINSWISDAFGRTVRELDLYLNVPIVLPLSHIYCNVVVLKLKGMDILFNIPTAASICFPNLHTLHLTDIRFAIANNSSVTFPNLKILHLCYIRFVNEDSVLKLFSSCPVLDNLIIRRLFDNVPCFIIRIPSLTRLTLYIRYVGYIRRKVLIDTPALQYLDLIDHLPCEYLHMKNLSCLLQAKVNVNLSRRNDVEKFISILKFIGSLSKVKFLSISGDVLKAMIRTASANILPSFHNVARLELEDHDCVELSVVINNFLESMENLEHLVIKGGSCNCSEHTWWTEPLNVPKCLLMQVTTVSFHLTNVDCRAQLELLRHFLKNAEVLQLMTISTSTTSTSKEKFELLQKISMFPKGSRTCQVAFT